MYIPGKQKTLKSEENSNFSLVVIKALRLIQSLKSK